MYFGMNSRVCLVYPLGGSCRNLLFLSRAQEYGIPVSWGITRVVRYEAGSNSVQSLFTLTWAVSTIIRDFGESSASRRWKSGRSCLGYADCLRLPGIGSASTKLKSRDCSSVVYPSRYLALRGHEESGGCPSFLLPKLNRPDVLVVVLAQQEPSMAPQG